MIQHGYKTTFCSFLAFVPPKVVAHRNDRNCTQVTLESALFLARKRRIIQNEFDNFMMTSHIKRSGLSMHSFVDTFCLDQCCLMYRTD